MTTENRIMTQLAHELGCKVAQVVAAVGLMDEGATVPFIARYRKEATGGLSDDALRTLEERLRYLRELEERRVSIVESIDAQGKMTPELLQSLNAADTKQTLEDLYLPYKPKRRTRAQIAREAGLEPLAKAILADVHANLKCLAEGYVNAELNVADAKAALDGARDILAEGFAEDAALLARLRDALHQGGCIRSRVVEEKRQEAAKFQDYFEHQEALNKVASHRLLAMLRGRQQEFLQIDVDLPCVWLEEHAKAPHPFEGVIGQHHGLQCDETPRGQFLRDVCRWVWRVKLAHTIQGDVLNALRRDAEADAIAVFGRNLKDLLLAAPAGTRCTMGLDPGLRTGVKVAVVGSTGQVLATNTIYPHEPRKDWDGAIHTLAKLCHQHEVELIAIGNGTASRQTDDLAKALMKQHPELKLKSVVVSEAGASVYSASQLASNELPELDVSLRGAVSIARRLQDPLAELVKIDPKSIGVGQYQHDVDQRDLGLRLDAVVEDCVNAVGVEVNTASEPLLARVAGLSSLVAKSIVGHRTAHGPFKSRAALREVPRLGDKTFEQAAGFLRIHGAENPLDTSAVHPEAYGVVERMAQHLKQSVDELIGNGAVLQKVDAKQFVDERFGLPTVADIVQELLKPGRDPRPSFVTAKFNDAVHDMKDLKPGMLLEGMVTNVANFGAFVDVGVHQDGLVHVSHLAEQFVQNPHLVVKAGQVVKVKVLEVDVPRKRISLSMRLGAETHASKPARAEQGGKPRGSKQQDMNSHQGRPPKFENKFETQKGSQGTVGNALAEAFAKAKQAS